MRFSTAPGSHHGELWASRSLELVAVFVEVTVEASQGTIKAFS